MKRLMGLFLLLGATASVSMAAGDPLKVDFGTSATANVEAGYVAYVATSNNPADYAEQFFTAFEAQIGVKPSWAGTNTGGARCLDRGLLTYTGEYGALVRDWIGTKTVDTDNDPMKLTITGLPAGVYDWVSYHHDTSTQHANFIVTVEDASGTTVNPAMNASRSSDSSALTWDAVAKFATSFESNGVTPIVLTFDVTTGGWEEYFVMNGFEITSGSSHGKAFGPLPLSGDQVVDSLTLTELSWSTAIDDPNIVSIANTFDVTFTDDPNLANNQAFRRTFTGVTSPLNLADNGLTLDFDSVYYWWVNSTVTWNYKINGSYTTVVEGDMWSFKTMPDNLQPIVTAGADVLSAIDLGDAALTATIDDRGEGDIVSVDWEIVGMQAAATSMQMSDRLQYNATDATIIANLAAVTTDANFYVDWIGTDAREIGNPMALTISGLPAGTYSWKSYHFDPESQHGAFEVTVFDANGQSEATSLSVSNGASATITTFETSISSNGTDDVTFVFEVQPFNSDLFMAFFVMNGFELTKGTDTLLLDFSRTGGLHSTATGCVFYDATHENAGTFTKQSYDAFGASIGVLPTWGSALLSGATVTPASAVSSTATFSTPTAGTYTVKITATDNGQPSNEIKSGSDTMLVQIDANACLAAQHATGWPGFSAFDANSDCVIDINDFAAFAGQWLNDLSLTEQVVR